MQFVVCLRIFLLVLDLYHLFVLPLYVILVMVMRYSWYPHNVLHIFAMICSATTEMSPWISSAPGIMSSPVPIVIILSQRWCLSNTTLAFALTVLVQYSDCIKLSSIIISYYVCEKEVTENPSVRREDGHGECSVSLAAVLLAITNMARCRRLRVVTVIDIICHCCCCCFLLFFSVSETVSVPVVK